MFLARIAPALLGALMVLAVLSALVLAAGKPLGASFQIILQGATGYPRGEAFGPLDAWDAVLHDMTLLVLTGLAVAVALQAGLFNIGAAGQLLVGALVAAWVGAQAGIPAPLHLPAALAAGALAGALWAFPPAWLKTHRGAHEVISTIMFNYIALYLTHWLVTARLKDPAGDAPQTAPIAEAARLGMLHEAFLQASWGLAIAVLVALGLWLVLYRTVWGYEMRATGANRDAADAAGAPTARRMTEAMLLSGALAGSLWVGLAAAVLVGLALALIHAVATQELRTDHIVSGVAINLLALGLSTYLFRQLIVPREEAGESSVVPTFGAVSLGRLENLPLLNVLVKDQSWLTLFALGLPFVLLVLLTRTRWGLRVYAVGNDSQKARMMGVPVKRLRYLGVLLSGALAGMAGAFLVLTATGQFRENMSAGRGFIALAALIFGRWHPLGAAGAALGFGFFEALQMRLQGQPVFGVQLPTDLLLMLPYLLTVIALMGLLGRMKPPSDLGN
jgi:ABC-type uncharacterized transport system permease subunit